MKLEISFTILFLLLFEFVQAVTIVTNKTSYFPGENITVTFDGATAKTDWIGLYLATITPGPQNSVAWLYLNGTQKVPSEMVKSGTLTFSAPETGGSYKVCFHPNDGYTVTSVSYFDVTITDMAPVAGFYGSPYHVLPGGTVHFTDQSVYSPDTWAWSFPGGIPSISSEQNPLVKYIDSGTYNVSLNVSNSAGSNQLTRTGYITVSDSAKKSTDLTFLHLNTWLEGTSVANGNKYIRDIIATVKPDIVCFVEVENYTGDWTRKMANDLAALGLVYYTGHLNGSDASILSKYPVVSSGPLIKSAISIFKVDINGNTIIVAPAHLDYLYYACYLPRGYRCGGSPPYNGWSQIGSPDPQPVTDLGAISTQNLGSKRDEQIGDFLNYVKNETCPIVILGDFNEPSCQDWTLNQANLFDHHGVVYEWNTTNSLISNNFTDAYRKIFPDEVLNPGFTWPSYATGVGSTSWTPKSDERDRIDYIFYRGKDVKAVNASIVGPKSLYVKNTLSTADTEMDIFLADTLPWPSDHKGVFSTITIPAVSDTNTVDVNELHSVLPFRIKVFPNPCSGTIHLMTSSDEHARIVIKDISGKKVFSKKVKLQSNNVYQIDINHVQTGIYFLSFISKNNSQTVKIIRQ